MKNDFGEITAALVGAIIGAVLAAVFGILTAYWLRNRDARIQFRIFISIKKGEIDLSEIPQMDFWKFYNDSRPKIREELYRLLPFLSERKIRSAEKLWNEYNTITHDKFDPPYSSPIQAKYEGKQPTNEMLVEFMDKFHKISNFL